ncbi:MAG: flippase activity-associated protein Agl23 [Chloroflexota bacterium]
MVQLKERPLSSPAHGADQAGLPSTSDDRILKIIFLALMVVGFLLRMHDIGARALHHDESLHATYSWYLYSGRGYVHDPLMHGPEQFHVNAFLFFLFGDNDVTARLQYVLLGTFMIGLPYFVRHELGKLAAVIAGVLLTISPGYLYFSRFAREDMPFAFFTMVMAVGLFGYIRTRQPKHLYIFSAAFSLSFATKEATYITGFIWTVFVILMIAIRKFDRDGDEALDVVRSLSPGLMGRCLLIFFSIYALLFTTFLTNLGNPWECLAGRPCTQGGIVSGSYGALKYWIDQHDVQRGGQPWFYYLLLLTLYEFIPLTLALIAVAQQRFNLFGKFCLAWSIGALVIYSYAGEKMPWLILHLTLPLILTGAPVLARWIQSISPDTWRSPSLRYAIGLWVSIVAFTVAFVAIHAVQWLNVIDGQALGLERLTLILFVLGAAGSLIWIARTSHLKAVRTGLACALLFSGTVFYVRTAWLATYEHADVPRDMLIYVQSSPDVVWVTRELERIGFQTGQGKDLRILMDNGYTETVGGQPVVHEAVSWPFEWYLRGYKNRRYFSRTVGSDINLRDYPAILVMAPNLDPIRPALGDYTGTKYKLNWWFPEDYKGLSPTVILEGLSDPEQRGKLIKFFLYREPLNTLGAREFYLFVRKDIPGIGPGPLSSAPNAAVQTIPSAAPISAGSATVLARLGIDVSGQSQLIDPKDVAIDASGRLYVSEGRANRVSILDRDGSVVGRFGQAGSGAGQLNEPWGLTVAPNGDVYVADTWNHRIQRFDQTGQFLGQWGVLGDSQGQIGVGPGLFWGPRDIALGPDGRLYITDTGNKRVQIFDMAGNSLGAIGGEGAAPGRLREPVGLAWGTDGLWIADAWNNRVQRISADGTALSQTAVVGWESQAITNKPYLAVSPNGSVIASAPDAGQLIVVTPAGQVRTVSLEPGPLGAAQPTGITVAASGEVYIVDSRNGVVLRLARLD